MQLQAAKETYHGAKTAKGDAEKEAAETRKREVQYMESKELAAITAFYKCELGPTELKTQT